MNSWSRGDLFWIYGLLKDFNRGRGGKRVILDAPWFM